MYRAGLILIIFTMAGCVERKETLKIQPDGSVHASVKFKADERDELYEGRVPSMQAGWTVSESFDGEKAVLQAEQTFPHGTLLPQSYAAEAGLHLAFPTSLKIEEREDGTYYHFHRIYRSRPFAFIEMLKLEVSGDRIDELSKQKPSSLSPNERLDLIRYMARFKMLKCLSFARKAFIEVTPDAAQDKWLHVRVGMLDLLNRLDYPRIASLLGREDADHEIISIASRFDQDITQGFSNLLGAEYSQEQMVRFRELYQLHERRYEITEDLNGETFDITLLMPGVITGTNGELAPDGRITWIFNGKMLHDRDLELMATSCVKESR